MIENTYKYMYRVLVCFGNGRLGFETLWCLSRFLFFFDRRCLSRSIHAKSLKTSITIDVTDHLRKKTNTTHYCLKMMQQFIIWILKFDTSSIEYNHYIKRQINSIGLFHWNILAILWGMRSKSVHRMVIFFY